MYFDVRAGPPAALASVLAAFAPVDLADLAERGLMDRAELKYVLPEAILAPVLAELPRAYRVLAVTGRRQVRYRSLYFDTPDLALYLRHHAGVPDRYKIRSREYLDSQAAFFEVKHRLPNRRTRKSRIATTGLLAAPAGPAAAFLASYSPYAADDLQASLWNAYTRITLVSKTRCERVTLDLNVEYARDDARLALPGIVIAEVKYDPDAPGGAWASPFVAAMRRRGIHSIAFSKYCIGLSLLCPDLKQNRFKAAHLLVHRLMQGEEDGRR